MNRADLERANELYGSIKELDNFLWTLRRVREGCLISEKQRYIFKSLPYGSLEEHDYIIRGELKDNLVEHLSNYLNSMKEEFRKIGGDNG